MQIKIKMLFLYLIEEIIICLRIKDLKSNDDLNVHKMEII